MQHNGNTVNRVQRYSPNATGGPVYSATQPNDVTMGWPAFEYTYARLEAALQYNFSRPLTGRLFYAFESFTKKD